MTDDTVATVSCRECGMEILPSARVCGYCECYQTRWRNELRYFANIVGVFTLIGTAVFFSITLAPSLRLALFWTDEVAVLRVDGGNLTLANSGDGKVFIYEVVFSFPGADALTHTVNDTLSPGEVLQIEGKEYHLASDESLAEGNPPYRLQILSETDSLWSRAAVEAAWEWYERTGDAVDVSCFQIIPVSEGGNYWNRVRRYVGDDPSSVAIEGQVRGFSLGRARAFFIASPRRGGRSPPRSPGPRGAP